MIVFVASSQLQGTSPQVSESVFSISFSSFSSFFCSMVSDESKKSGSFSSELVASWLFSGFFSSESERTGEESSLAFSSLLFSELIGSFSLLSSFLGGDSSLSISSLSWSPSPSRSFSCSGFSIPSATAIRG